MSLFSIQYLESLKAEDERNEDVTMVEVVPETPSPLVSFDNPDKEVNWHCYLDEVQRINKLTSLQGWLKKEGRNIRSWNKRWFVLKDNFLR